MPDGFNARKAAQVIAFFASKSPQKRLHVLKAIKLVYLADRKCLERFGYPVVDDDRVSMPHGPVNSMTYRHVNGEYEDSGWSEFLRDRSNHQLSLKQNAPIDDLDELSDAELSCLDEVWHQFGHMTQWELRDWTHNEGNVPEWEDPNGSSWLIPLQRILRVLNFDKPKEQARQIEDFRAIDRLFDSLRK